MFNFQTGIRFFQMIVALELDRDIDLALFSRYLAQSGVRHRITEEGDKQVVWVASEAEIDTVQALFDRIDRGELRLEEVERAATTKRAWYRSPHVIQFLRAPLTLALVIVNLLFFPVTFGIDNGEISDMLHRMTFVAFQERSEYLYFADVGWTFRTGEYWRLLSPMFLHFGAMHIVFNLLWVWEIGRRIEVIRGALMLLLVVFVSSLSANFLQYMMSGPSLFGGMSGVVFGLLGFGLVWSRMVPERTIGLPNGIYIFMLIFLVAGFTGVFDYLLLGSLANGAHLGGLLAGLAIGFIAASIERAGRA
jgi:GlpG protein